MKNKTTVLAQEEKVAIDCAVRHISELFHQCTEHREADFGECWIDNDYMAETTALEATVKLNTTEVTRTGTLEKGYKVTGITCSGTLKLNKVTSYMLKKIGDNLKKGKATRATIISNIEDPEAFGAERIRLDDVVFTEIKLADWEAEKLLEESIPFSFSGWEVLESIDV